MIRRILTVCFGVVLGAIQASSQTFSVSPGPGGPGTPSPSGLAPDDLFTLGPLVTAPGAGPVLPGDLFVNVDAISFGYFGVPQSFLDLVFSVGGFEYSVTPASGGAAATDVAFQAAGGVGGPGDQAADIFFSSGAGGNSLVFDGDGIANPTTTVPDIGLIEPFSTPGDDVDAYDRRSGIDEDPVFFSVDPLSLGLPPGFADPSDIYLSSFIPGYDFMPPASLYAAGLGPVGVAGSLQLVSGDNVDALVVLDDGDLMFLDPGGAGPADMVLFSLSPSAPSFTTAGSPYFGASPADILFADSAGTAGVLAVPGPLGLTASDDINALDIVVPEPSTSVLFLIGLAGMLTAFQRRKA